MDFSYEIRKYSAWYMMHKKKKKYKKFIFFHLSCITDLKTAVISTKIKILYSKFFWHILKHILHNRLQKSTLNCKKISSVFGTSIARYRIRPSYASYTHFFSYKNFFYKNIQAQNAKFLRTSLRTSPAWDFWYNTYFEKRMSIFYAKS